MALHFKIVWFVFQCGICSALYVGCLVSPCAGLPSNVRSRSGQPCSLCRAGDLRVLRPARRIHIRRRGRVLRNSPPPASVRSATDPNRGRAWHPREFGAVLGGSASLPLPAPPLPSSSRRYAPQCFVGEYTSSPCDVSHRASDEPRRRMSLSSALAPSSLASPSHRRVFLRSFCARRRPVNSLNFVCVSKGEPRSGRCAGCKSVAPSW